MRPSIRELNWTRTNRTMPKPMKSQVPPSSLHGSVTDSGGHSPGRRAWLRFRRNKSAMVSLVVMSIITLTCLLCLSVSSNNYFVQDLDYNWAPPLANINTLNTDNDGIATPDGEKADGATKPKHSVLDRLFGYDILGRSMLWPSMKMDGRGGIFRSFLLRTPPDLGVS